MNATTPPRVLVADALDRAAIDILEQEGLTVWDEVGISASDLAAKLPEVDALLVRSRTRVTAEMLKGPSRLRAIGRAGSGVDNIDLPAATAAGVVVMNVPGGNSIAAAEHTLALLFALARHIAPAAQSVREGQWTSKPYLGFELTGKTLGVVGLGRIGREVARRAQGLQMHVLGADPCLDRAAARDLGFELLGLEEIVSRSDILTLHVPLSEATRGLINAQVLAAAKPGLVLINAARGGIVEESALWLALEEGRVFGAALDVLSEEPPKDRRLIDHPRVLVTPHLGANTREAQVGVATAIARQVARYLLQGVAEHAVTAKPVNA